MATKTEQLIAYIAKKHGRASITVLMKLAYLADLISVEKRGVQISEFAYRRFTYGPFDQKIYSVVEKLIDGSAIQSTSDFTPFGDEYEIFSFNEKSDFSFDQLSTDEIGIVDGLLEIVNGYGAKTLTEIAYKTKPMLALGATLGGNENIDATLNLATK